MKICDRLNTRVVLLITIALLALPAVSLAQTDEIQVYDASIAERGVFNLTLHNNFTPDGLNHPAFPGGLIPDKSLNGVAEWAYGVADWFEAGLYLPLYSISKDRSQHKRRQTTHVVCPASRRDAHIFLWDEFRIQLQRQTLGRPPLHFGDPANHRRSFAPGRHYRESHSR